MLIFRRWLSYVLALATVLLSVAARAQTVDDIWQMRGNVVIDGLLYSYDAASGTCGTAALPNQQLGGLAKVLIYKIVTPKAGTTAYAIILKSNNSDGPTGTFAKIARLYCLSDSGLKDNFSPQEPLLTGGVLSVPFKLRFAPVKIMSGGAIGGFVGHKFHHTKDIASTVLAFASLTNVPLNDLNNKVPETQWGLGTGAGWVLTIPDNFQVGVVAGWDIFSWPADWPYKKTPWLSVSIGYSFVGPQKQDSVKAAAALQQQ